jgi:hypothetical protein
VTPDPAVADRLTPNLARPSFLALRDRPDSIHRLRQFAGSAVFGLPYAADEVELIAVEIVTNAIHAVRNLGREPYDLWPIGVEITATHRYMHLKVTDPDHRPIAGVDEGGQLAEHGRGLGIVDHLAAARWVTYAEHGKTVHVVVAASGATLTPAELQQIREAR